LHAYDSCDWLVNFGAIQRLYSPSVWRSTNVLCHNETSQVTVVTFVSMMSNGHRLSCGDCLEDKSENYQLTVQCCTVYHNSKHTHTYEQFLQVY